MHVAQSIESFYRAEKNSGQNRLVYSRVAEAREVPRESVMEEDKLDAQLQAKMRELERRGNDRREEQRASGGRYTPTGNQGNQRTGETGSLKCCKCGLPGHFARECPARVCPRCRRPGRGLRECPRGGFACFRCRQEGHIARNCLGNECGPTQGSQGRPTVTRVGPRQD